MNPLRIPSPADELASGDLYRLEFWAPIQGVIKQCWVNDLVKEWAEEILGVWQDQSSTWMSFCKDCPIGVADRCKHEGTPERPIRFRFAEIPQMRIMPMREAL